MRKEFQAELGEINSFKGREDEFLEKRVDKGLDHIKKRVEYLRERIKALDEMKIERQAMGWLMDHEYYSYLEDSEKREEKIKQELESDHVSALERAKEYVSSYVDRLQDIVDAGYHLDRIDDDRDICRKAELFAMKLKEQVIQLIEKETAVLLVNVLT